MTVEQITQLANNLSLITSDAADEQRGVTLGGLRLIQKKKKQHTQKP